MSLIARFLDPKNDFAFKQVFGTKKHKGILIPFLNDVLKLTGEHIITDVQFLTPIQDPEIAAKKQSIVDVLCKDESGRQFIIEMQVAKTTGFKERAIFYASKAYVNQMVKGGQYEHLKEVIFIAIIDYELFPNKVNYHSTHRLYDQDTHEHDLSGLRFEFLELPRFKKNLDDITTMVEKWCYYFKYAPETTLEELERLVGSDEVIKEAYQALDSASWTEDELRLYEQETKSENDALSMLRQAELEGIEKGREEGIEKGLAQGRAELQTEKLAIASNMLVEGLPTSVIVRLTKLTEAEVDTLRTSG
jgi:predicted transposase/invertase (TIGR01784 family)